MPKVKDRPVEPAAPVADFRFDVAHDPWITVVRNDETRTPDLVGLVEALCDAHLLAAVRDPLPPVECSIIRELVTFAHDIFMPRTGAEWQAVWKQKRFDADKVREYFRLHADKMRLFDDKHPFLQDAGADGPDKPLAGLLPSQPAGTNAAHFHHGVEDEFAVSPATAARLLTTIAPFMTAGGAGLSPSINGAPPWYVLLQGKTLFETVWLSCPVREVAEGEEEDVPAWRDLRATVKEDRNECGFLEALTWRPRRIRLVPKKAPEGKGYCDITGLPSEDLVARMKFSAGWSTRFDKFEWTDPHVPYRITKEGKTVLRPKENRDLWRDAGALALGRGKESQRPAIVKQFADFQLAGYGHLPPDTPLSFVAYGMRTDMKMKIFEWHREELSLPVPLILDEHFAGIAESAMKVAEEVAYALKAAIKRCYERGGAGNERAFDSLITSAQTRFWQRLRPHYLGAEDALLNRIAPLNPESGRDALELEVDKWRQAVKRVGRTALEEAIGDLRGTVGGLDANGDAMERQVLAHDYFESRLRMVTGNSTKKAAVALVEDEEESDE